MNWLVEPNRDGRADLDCGLVLVGGCLATVLCKSLCLVDCDLCGIYVYRTDAADVAK